MPPLILHHFRCRLPALVISLVAFWVAFLTGSHAQGPARATGELLVKPARGVSEVQLHAILSAHGATQVDGLQQLNVRIVRLPAHALERVLTALQRDHRVDFAEKNFVAQAFGTANDPFYTSGQQWHLAKIQAPLAWDLTTGAASAVIAVLDTGANFAHPDLRGKLLAGYDFVNNDPDPSDDNGHGTGVSGAAAAASNNSTGVASVAWGTLVMPLKVLDASGSGSYSNIARAITYAADNGARVINLSLGATSSSRTLQDAVDYAWGKGAVIIAAAGNNGNNTPCYPAACQNVVAVSATNASDVRPSWSNYGSYVDMSAPGENILTTYHSDYYNVSGTSFSSPITAAVAALMASIQPNLSNSQIVDLLLKNSDDIGAGGYDVFYGHGPVNASRAVSAARTLFPSDTTAPLVTISSPADGSVLSGTVSVNASATDNVGVVRMEILIDGALVAQGASSSLSLSWNTLNAANGAHRIEVRAHDAAGNVGSAVVAVTVQNTSLVDATAPEVSITSPKDRSIVTGTVRINVAASDNVAVTRVDLYIDSYFAASSTSANPVFSWNTKKASKGEHKLQAFAYDAAGNIGASAVVTVMK